jgi:nucleoside-diphosphate kinase
LEQTFVMVKPDGVERGLIHRVIERIENKGFRLAAIRMLRLTDELAAQHYAEHVDKPFFPELRDFITSGPVVAMVWEGNGVIKAVRDLMGATNPLASAPGTIRGDFGLLISKNIVHGSDSPEAAAREISLYFKNEEILAYERSIDLWIC